MSASSSSAAASPRQRDLAVLVAPSVTLLGVIALITIARYRDSLPFVPTECRFREATGIPCAGCGGSRSLDALAHGNLGRALFYHPAAVLGVAASIGWFLHGALRFIRRERSHRQEIQDRRMKQVLLITIGLALLNWIYLLFFLP